MNKTRAILMAAGVGSRLGTYTTKPKSALDVSGQTIVEHTLNILSRNDIHASLVVGYRKDYVMDLLKDYDVGFVENPFYRITNSIASLWCARDLLVEAAENGEDVILGNADVFWGAGLLDVLLSSDLDNMLLSDRTRVEVGDYFFMVQPDGQVTAHGKGLALDQRNCEYVGLGKISARFLPTFIEHLDKLIWSEDYNKWWENVLYDFKDECPVYAVDVEGQFWGEVDTIEDYERILNYIAEHPEQF